MELIVRAVDVGSGNTKFVTGVVGNEIRCASFPSVAYPSSGETPHWPASERRKTIRIQGELPNPLNPPSGCAFHKRCPHAQEQCREQVPELRPLQGRMVACHRAEEIA